MKLPLRYWFWLMLAVVVLVFLFTGGDPAGALSPTIVQEAR